MSTLVGLSRIMLNFLKIKFSFRMCQIEPFKLCDCSVFSLRTLMSQSTGTVISSWPLVSAASKTLTSISISNSTLLSSNYFRFAELMSRERHSQIVLILLQKLNKGLVLQFTFGCAGAALFSMIPRHAGANENFLKVFFSN